MARKDFAGWYRVGGHRLQFYATDAEIAEWLEEMLLPAFAPYRIVGQDRAQPFEYALEAINECFAHHLRIFERLRRSMRKRLVVQTAFTFADGEVGEHWPMTARAADAHTSGEVRFAAQPVGRRS